MADHSTINHAGVTGLATSDSPQFAGVNLGHASDTTLTRASAGVVAVEGTNLVKAGAATGSGLTMATARILGRTTASSGAIEEITVGSGLSLSAGSLTATGGGSTTFAGVSAHHGSDQALNNGSITVLTFTATDVYDTDAYHDTGTNPTRLTVPSGKDGYYIPWATMYFTGSTNGAYRQIQFRKNGTTNIAAPFKMPDAASAVSVSIAVSGPPVSLVATDYLECVVLVDGASLNAVFVSGESPLFGMYRIGT